MVDESVTKKTYNLSDIRDVDEFLFACEGYGLKTEMSDETITVKGKKYRIEDLEQDGSLIEGL